MVWLEAVAGRLKTDIRYSAGLVYNTFPVPPLAEGDRLKLAEAGIIVLGAREQHAGQSLAELYDPEAMPDGLVRAHHDLDVLVDVLYGLADRASDDERRQLLFQMYARVLNLDGAHA